MLKLSDLIELIKELNMKNPYDSISNNTKMHKDTATVVELISKDTTVKKLTGIVPPSVDEVFKTMLSDIVKVDLVETLQNDFSDDLLKYVDKKTREVDQLKIPEDMYIVAIVHEINKVAKRKKWMIAKQHGIFYLFNGVHWQRVEDDTVSAFFSKASAKVGYFSPAKAKTSTFTKKGIEQLYTDATMIIGSSKDKTVRINLLNGTLEITGTSHRLKLHDPSDFLKYVLPFEYDTKAKAPLFEKYLDRVLPDKSSQMVLQEFHGYVFIKHLKLEKALILLGVGKNGKSVMFEIDRALFGSENISTKGLGDLTDRDSGNDNRAKLADKLLNYGSEIRAKDIDVDIFKRLVSGEPVAAREKYKTGFDLENACKLMFNANTLPMGAENTEAYFRRFLIVAFNETITEAEKDPELHTKIIESELPGVLNWAIKGLDRLLIQKKFTRCLTADDALEQYKKESNTVIGYIEEYDIVTGISSFKLVNALYKEYRIHCMSSGYKPLAKNDFSTELVKLGFKKHRTAKGRGFYASKKVYHDTGDTDVTG